MKNLEISNKMTENDKIKYEAPVCDFIELDLESPVLQASGNGFEDGGSYDRGNNVWGW